MCKCNNEHKTTEEQEVESLKSRLNETQKQIKFLRSQLDGANIDLDKFKEELRLGVETRNELIKERDQCLLERDKALAEIQSAEQYIRGMEQREGELELIIKDLTNKKARLVYTIGSSEDDDLLSIKYADHDTHGIQNAIFLLSGLKDYLNDLFRTKPNTNLKDVIGNLEQEEKIWAEKVRLKQAKLTTARSTLEQIRAKIRVIKNLINNVRLD